MIKPCPLQWSDIGCTDGPALKDHAGLILGDCLYVHGGQTARRDSMTEARQGLYRIRLSPSVGTWTDLTTSDSPSLSQHACLSMEDRYLVFIGGWTGKTRIPGVHTYDTVSQKWLPPALNEPLLKGFPSGAGLSAHSATKMQPHPAGLGSFTSLIIGREGSLRTQRKAGNIYLLYGNVRGSGSDDKKAHYTYCEANSQLATSSRSYHTSFAASPNTLVTVGGRKDHVIELLRWKSSSKNLHSLDWPGTLVYPPDTCTVVTDLIKQVHQKKLKLSEAVIKNQWQVFF
ncbi:Kelch domain-containing protein 9 [Fasciola gigantica]|uniref:Kelch domain-containing protein 9 n=1 Tax=Fasciola gigantica TaxID=46835 RepID=A0A504YGP0_FASGI|nr:Kelch domain-containing protein 9 [Fasciola gigantica]